MFIFMHYLCLVAALINVYFGLGAECYDSKQGEKLRNLDNCLNPANLLTVSYYKIPINS